MTLLEVVTLMAVSLVISGLALTILIKFLGLSNASRDHLQRSLVLFRLSEQLRADVHAATHASIEGDPATLDLTLPAGRHVNYSIVGGSAERTVYDQQTVVARDTFELPGERIARWEVSGDDRPSEVVAIVERLNPEGVESDEAQPTIRIRAVVGRDLRFAQVQAK